MLRRYQDKALAYEMSLAHLESDPAMREDEAAKRIILSKGTWSHRSQTPTSFLGKLLQSFKGGETSRSMSSDPHWIVMCHNCNHLRHKNYEYPVHLVYLTYVGHRATHCEKRIEFR